MRCASPPERLGAARFERQIPQPDAIEEAQSRADFRQGVAGDRGLARRQFECLEEAAQRLDRQGRELGNRALAKAQVQRRAVEASALAAATEGRGAGRFGGGFEPLRFLASLFNLELLAAHAGAKAIRTPALTGIE